jgi:hypothetical protein
LHQKRLHGRRNLSGRHGAARRHTWTWHALIWSRTTELGALIAKVSARAQPDHWQSGVRSRPSHRCGVTTDRDCPAMMPEGSRKSADLSAVSLGRWRSNADAAGRRAMYLRPTQ